VSVPVVSAEHVSKWYGQVIGLNDVSVHVPPGITALLDPDERLLIDQATKLEKAFLDKGFRQVSGDDVMKAANEVLAFKTVGEKGIYAGKIKSIISPRLASHVRREAIRFVDELKRKRLGRARTKEERVPPIARIEAMTIEIIVGLRATPR
jgi:hypothetical protein